jgi:hypothetical protein
MNLRERLRQEATENADRDLAMAAEWFPLEEEVAGRAESGAREKRTRKRQ